MEKRLQRHSFPLTWVQIKKIFKAPAGVCLSLAILSQEINKMCYNHGERTIMMGPVGKPRLFVAYNNYHPYCSDA